MTTTTDDDITRAQQELDQATAYLAEAESMIALGGQATTSTGAVWAGAKGAHEQAASKLARLFEAREQARQDLVIRAAAEKTHKKATGQRATELKDSRDRLTATISAVQDALLCLADAVTEHNTLIRQHAAEMAAAGLSPVIEGHDVGSDPGTGLVVLGGEAWVPLDGGSLVYLATERTRLSQFDRNGQTTYAGLAKAGMDRVRAAAVIDRVAPPHPADLPARLRAEPAPIHSVAQLNEEQRRFVDGGGIATAHTPHERDPWREKYVLGIEGA